MPPSASPWERVIAIGDIHGCSRALDAVLDQIRPTRQDLIVCLGDFIDQGKDTCGVIDRLIDLQRTTNFVCLMGNHEEMLGAALWNEKARRYWETAGGISTLMSYHFGATLATIPAEHWEFILTTWSYFETDQFIFTHANYEADLPLNEQTGPVLRWEPLDPSRVRPHYSGKTVIVGHTEQRGGELLDLGPVRCLDTYCYGHGFLTAQDVLSGMTWQANRFGDRRPTYIHQPVQAHRIAASAVRSSP